MTREDLIKNCKYYKGEKETPDNCPEPGLWCLELEWVELTMADDEILERYGVKLLRYFPEIVKRPGANISLLGLALVHFAKQNDTDLCGDKLPQRFIGNFVDFVNTYY